VSFFRKHIIKIGVILLLQLGFMICLFPTQQRHRTTRTFTNWLSSYLKGKKNDTVKKKVENLGVDSGEISQLMVKASELISKNADRFNIPLKNKKPSEKDVYKVLLVEWNIYHQSTTTGNAVSVEQSKNQLFYNTEKGPHSPRTATIPPSSDHYATRNIEINTSPSSFKPHSAIPLIGGIAIGAP